MANLGAGNYTNEYIGAEALLLSRDIREKIGMPYKEDTLLDFFIGGRGTKKAQRRLKLSKNTTFHWWEYDYLIGRAVIGSVAGTPAAGNDVTITITALGDLSSPFIVNDLVMVGGIQGWVKTVTIDGGGAHDYVITPVDNTDDIVTASTPTEPIVWFGSAFADGTTLPQSKVRKPIKYDNKCQIIKTDYEADAGEAANWSEPFIEGNKKFYYRRGVMDLILRHKMAIEYTMIMGKPSVGLLDTNNSSKAINTTAGLEYLVDQNGVNISNPTFAYAQMQEIEREADKAMAPSEYIGLIGHELKLSIDSALLDKNQNTGIKYDAFGSGNAQKRAVDLGFDSYKLGTRTYHIKAWNALNYEQITGNNGYDMNGRGFFMPDDIVKQKGGETSDSICLRYKASDRENRFMIDDTRGMKQTGKDSFEYYALSDVGLQTCLLPQYIKYDLA